VAACAKHFPGHGDTSTDSHLVLPVAAEDPRLGALEPFRAAIAAGVRSIMSAHLLVPALDSVPATLSHRILTDLLRGELGFRGLLITDGLEMRAISAGVGIAEGTVQALVAGCDALCIGGGLAEESIVDQLRDAILEAVQAGRLSEERLAEAAGRIDALAAWRAEQQPAPAAARGIGLEAARRALQIDGSVRAGADALVVQLRPGASIAVGAVAWGIAPAALTFDGPPVDVERVLGSAEGRGLVLVVRDLHRHRWQAEAVQALLARRPDAVLVEMGLPACRPEGARSYVTTFGAGRVNGEAAAEQVLR
jgi:beta-N-acetylhexosaminidase